MYAIFSGNELITICDKPRYTVVKEDSGAFIEAPSEEAATGVAAGTQNYSIAGKGVESYPGAPVAEIRNIDGASAYLFEALVKSLQSEKDCSALDGAVMDLGTITQEQYDDLSGAVMDLAEIIAANNA
jgi:hypothetical protein